MKKTKWVWINAAVAIGLIALSVFGVLGVQRYLKDQEDNKMFRLKAEDIYLFTLERSYNGYSGGDIDKLYPSITLSGKDEIAALVECIRAVEENNRRANTGIESPPHYYEFTFLMYDGDSPTYTYNVYYTGKNFEMNDPFDALFALPSVQEKLERIRAYYR